MFIVQSMDVVCYNYDNSTSYQTQTISKDCFAVTFTVKYAHAILYHTSKPGFWYTPWHPKSPFCHTYVSRHIIGDCVWHTNSTSITMVTFFI